jgi:hypothetical protein
VLLFDLFEFSQKFRLFTFIFFISAEKQTKAKEKTKVQEAEIQGIRQTGLPLQQQFFSVVVLAPASFPFLHCQAQDRRHHYISIIHAQLRLSEVLLQTSKEKKESNRDGKDQESNLHLEQQKGKQSQEQTERVLPSWTMSLMKLLYSR